MRFDRALAFTAGWTAALSLMAVGAAYISRPTAASRRLFGVPADTSDERMYLVTKAVRDLALGLITAALLRRGDRRATAIALGVGAIGPVTDGALMIKAEGARPQLAAHWGAAALMAIAALSLGRETPAEGGVATV